MWVTYGVLKYLDIFRFTKTTNISLSAEHRDSKGLLEGKPCVCLSDIAVRPSSGIDAPDLGLPSVKVQQDRVAGFEYHSKH